MNRKLEDHPAYPYPRLDSMEVPYPGLSKLELFSAMAMQGILSNPSLMEEVVVTGKEDDYVEKRVAGMALTHARALMERLGST